MPHAHHMHITCTMYITCIKLVMTTGNMVRGNLRMLNRASATNTLSAVSLLTGSSRLARAYVMKVTRATWGDNSIIQYILA